jgi:hypothetical protein
MTIETPQPEQLKPATANNNAHSNKILEPALRIPFICDPSESCHAFLKQEHMGDPKKGTAALDAFHLLALKFQKRQKSLARASDRGQVYVLLLKMLRKYTPAEFVASATRFKKYLHDLLGEIQSWKNQEESEESQEREEALA